MSEKNIRTVKELFLIFWLYAMIGWLYEVLLEVVVYRWGFTNRGVLFGPYCPVYGVGALAFVFTIYKFIKGKDAKTKIKMIPVVFLGSMLIATGIELVTSYICEFFTGSWPWQTYVDYAINFEGRVALSPSIRFGIGGTVFLYLLQPLFERICGKMSKSVINKAFYALLIIVVIDAICTFLIF